MYLEAVQYENPLHSQLSLSSLQKAMEAFYCLIRCYCSLYTRGCVHLKATLQEMWNVQDLQTQSFDIHRSRGSRQVYAVALC